MAAFHASFSLLISRTDALLPEPGSRTDARSPGLHVVSINTSSRSPEGSSDMKSKHEEQMRRERISQQKSSTLMFGLSHTHSPDTHFPSVLWLHMQIKCFTVLSSRIKHADHPSFLCSCSCWMFLCAL